MVEKCTYGRTHVSAVIGVSKGDYVNYVSIPDAQTDDYSVISDMTIFFIPVKWLKDYITLRVGSVEIAI